MKKISILLVLSFLVLLSFACMPQKKYTELVNETAKIDSLRKVTQDSLEKLQAQLKRDTTERKQLLQKISNLEEKVALLKTDPDKSLLIDTIDSLKKANKHLTDTHLQYRQQQIKRLEQLEKRVATLEDSVQLLFQIKKKHALNSHNTAWRVWRFDNSFDYYIVDLTKSNFQLYWKDSTGDQYLSLRKLRSKLRKQDKELIFATNAGMYTPEHAPQGLYIEDSIKHTPLDSKTKGYGNFYMQPNGVFLIDKTQKARVVTTQSFKKLESRTLYATQSGPMLLTNGKMNPHFRKGSTNKHIRSGVGVISPTKIVFVISNKTVNFYDFATLFRENFGCKDALYLDGAISKMYLPELGRNELGGSFGAIIGVVK